LIGCAGAPPLGRTPEVLDHAMRQLERGEIGALEAIDALLGEELTLREARRFKAALSRWAANRHRDLGRL
jgi:hypothetical protein